MQEMGMVVGDCKIVEVQLDVNMGGEGRGLGGGEPGSGNLVASPPVGHRQSVPFCHLEDAIIIFKVVIPYFKVIGPLEQVADFSMFLYSHSGARKADIVPTTVVLNHAESPGFSTAATSDPETTSRTRA